MSSNAIAGVGTVFKRNDDALAEVTSIAGPSMSRNVIDVSSLDSTGGYKDFITGMRDAGEVTLTMNFTLATYSLMLGDFQESGAQQYAIEFLDAGSTIIAFSGYCTACPIDAITPDERITSSATIKLTGAIDITT